MFFFPIESGHNEANFNGKFNEDYCYDRFSIHYLVKKIDQRKKNLFLDLSF